MYSVLSTIKIKEWQVVITFAFAIGAFVGCSLVLALVFIVSSSAKSATNQPPLKSHIPHPLGTRKNTKPVKR